ncbi:DNRLRE domain-containing protein [Streptomyces liangshanensis]|uniref:DNRLRE domain-containing protein n=1 Tax=Streptomyces liangshanensis TaxID=2717324 RepID=UPI0036DDAC15
MTLGTATASTVRRRQTLPRVWVAALLTVMVSAPVPLLNRPETVQAAESPSTAPPTQGRSEIVSERTESTTTWANADGTTTVEAFTGPVRVKQPDGIWHPIDTTLVADGDLIKPRSAAAEIELSGGGSTRPLAQVRRGTHSLGLNWQGNLPKPRLKGPTAVYHDAVPGGDLVVTALKEGFSHSLILRERPRSAPVYRLPVAADGLTLQETSDHRLHWKDSKGHVKAAAPLPVMWDSSRSRVSGDSERVAPVDVTVEENGEDAGQVLVLRPDAGFLADPELTYPVTIDPTDSLTGPVTDTWIQYDDYLTSQRGSTELKSGTYDGTQKARAFLKFDTAKYAGKHITDTDLRLYSYYSATCATTGAGNQVRRITSDWDPAAITWAAQPTTTATGAVTSTAAKGYNSSCPAGPVSWDIDATVQAWADGQPNYGVRIAGADESDPTTWRRYYSANQTDGAHNPTYEPSLTVTYNSLPGTATAVSPPTGAALSDTTPTLSAKTNDADVQQLTHTFEIWTTAGTSALKTGTAPGAGSGATATWTSPALAAGSYKWRARASDGTDTGNWSAWRTFTLDTTVPTVPVITSSTHPSSSGWYAATTFAGSLTATDPDGIAGYAVKLDQSASTSAGTVVTQSGTGIDWTGRTDGTWWVHAASRNKAGLWSATKHLSFNVDTTAPAAPATLVSATHPVSTNTYASRTATFTWSAPADLSGIVGYAVVVDQVPTTLPATTSTLQSTTSLTTTVASDGAWYVHVRAKDKAGNWSAKAAHLAFLVDSATPQGPVISSSTHPDQTSAYRSGDLRASWSAPSGATGYSVVLDTAPGTEPDTVVETTATSYTATKGEGTWYLHVRAIGLNGAGLGTSHFRYTVDTTAPGTPTVTSTDYPVDAWAGGPGEPGVFTFTPNGNDTVAFTYVLDGAAPRTLVTTGGPADVRLTPTAGSHALTVTATDRAGNVSEALLRRFHVGKAMVTAPGNGEVLVGSVDLSVTGPADLTTVTFLVRASALDPWDVIPAAQVTDPVDGRLVTWPVAMVNGVSPKLVWDTSSLVGQGGRQIGARFGGAVTPPMADPVSVVIDRVEVIEGGLGDDAEQAAPAQAYALQQAKARADGNAETFAPPYIDEATGDLVAPVVLSSAVAEAGSPIQVTQVPADEGGDVVGTESEEADKAAGGETDAGTNPEPPAEEAQETTGEETYDMPEEEAPGGSSPDGTVTGQVTPRTEIVEHSTQALESLRDEVLELTDTDLPGSASLYAAFVEPESNRVVVEAPSVDGALVAALGERYGTDSVAVHLTPGVEGVEPQAGRQFDTSPYYGGARYNSQQTTSRSVWCTAGFPWRYKGKWYMLTAGHCTTGNGAVLNPSGTDYIGPVVRDNWNNSKGSVKLAGTSYYSGDLALYSVQSPSSATPRIYKGSKTSASSRLVHDYWRRWAQSGDKLCTGGMVTGERCGWKVTATQATVKYSSGTVARNMVVASKTSSACAQPGDSGGPVYTVDSSGRAYAKGIISGGGGGGSDHSGGLFDPCKLVFTDIGLANSALPGEVARG